MPEIEVKAIRKTVKEKIKEKEEKIKNKYPHLKNKKWKKMSKTELKKYEVNAVNEVNV